MTTSTPTLGEEIDQTSFAAVLDPNSEPMAELEFECLCPFCGSFNAGIGKACSNCHLEDNTANRAATKQRLGPWYVLQAANPSAPGMNFETLQKLIQGQLVNSRSVVRGPTTGQLWRLASKIRGLSREFGECYACGGDIESHETNCPHCDRIQTVPEVTEEAGTQTITPQVNAIVASPVMADDAKVVREALLAEPAVHHIQFINGPDADRPVLAEGCERHMPKDDLLTPQDVAKAFQLEFGLKQNQIDHHLYQPRNDTRNLKIAFSSAGALIAVLMMLPLVHVVSGWINSNQAEASTRSIPSVAVTPPRIEAYTDVRPVLELPAPRPAPVAAPVAVIPETVETAAPVIAPSAPVASAPISGVPAEMSTALATAAIAPVAPVEPTPAPSSEDDPTMLWNTGLNAESNGNFAAAVQAYERIESLPSYSWPAHLETRLALARKELKGEAK